MKNLTLHKNKLLTCLIFLCLVFLQSCRKDTLNSQDTTSSTNPKQQKISEATILKWMQTNPAAQALTLDWKNAKQATIEGKNVVRIPT